jgi:hypothetical protein
MTTPTTTTRSDNRRRTVWAASYRARGYFFREAAMLTIGLGVGLHLYRVIFGDDMTLRHVLTPNTDLLLLIPMTYAAIAGIASYHRMRFINRPHRIVITASLAYIAASVPLHVYFAGFRHNVDFYVDFFPAWFSYLLLGLVYPAFLVMLARLEYNND